MSAPLPRLLRPSGPRPIVAIACPLCGRSREHDGRAIVLVAQAVSLSLRAAAIAALAFLVLSCL